MSTETIEQPAVRRVKRSRDGYVLKDKMDKTIVVEVTRMMRHAKFKKVVRRKIKYSVHDEKNQAAVGDKVRILATRPLSKKKRWTLMTVLEKGA